MQGAFSSNVANTPAVKATGTNGAVGVSASSDTNSAVEGISDSNVGVTGASPNGGIGVVGRSVQGNRISGGIGVLASSDTGDAVNATSGSGIAVHASSTSNIGVLGESSGDGNNYGVVGNGRNAGVAAFNPSNNNAAYLASDCCAAWLTGEVHIAGPLTKSGGGFRIDHPNNPGEKYLSHSFVESPDMKNVYDGVAMLDVRGEADIELPAWFEALNSDFRYQLTAIGGPAPNLHIAAEISNNRFKIAGGIPTTKVSWQVTGIRRDAWAQAHRIAVDEAKPVVERGHFIHPELFGASVEQSIERVLHPDRIMPML